MKHLIPICIIVALAVACDRDAARSDGAVPTCVEVVAHSDQLTIEWAARESDEKGEAMRNVIENEKRQGGDDPAVTLCEEQLTAQQKRCVMAAKDLLQKNDCLGQ
jgi:hypothetical protein